MTSPAPRLPDLSVLFPFRAWLRHPALRAWTTWLFVALVATPPLALVLFPSASDLLGVEIMFAAYFAVAWFLVLWVVVRPQRVSAPLLVQVAAAEAVLVLLFLASFPAQDGDILDNLVLSFSVVGIPEEAVKALPALVLAVLHRRLALTPRDVLFLAATSGLVFGAIEAVLYAGDRGLLTTADALLMVWRFATDPIAHALWAGVAGYFIGIAVGYSHAGPWLALAGLGIGVPALLHGLSDWSTIRGGPVWALLEVVSALLFVAYARVGLVASRPAAVGARPLGSPTPSSMPDGLFPPTGRHAADVDPPTVRFPAPA